MKQVLGIIIEKRPCDFPTVITIETYDRECNTAIAAGTVRLASSWVIIIMYRKCN